jgi:hypothetical protein
VHASNASWAYAEKWRDALRHVLLGRYVRHRRSAIERWLDESQRGLVRADPMGASSAGWRL